VIDAYMSPLPSVTWCGRTIRGWSSGSLPNARQGLARYHRNRTRAAMQAEIEHVMLHSSSRNYVRLAIAGKSPPGPPQPDVVLRRW